ncbi:uncharacterized protein LOC143025318 [Oratosquilla oratoria]|uniref:uncharacterized protein LOC143025318 n=1 Tax=Oratosquilla oratoria TaxID=337810 RepID=UPI003F76FA66
MARPQPPVQPTSQQEKRLCVAVRIERVWNRTARGSVLLRTPREATQKEEEEKGLRLTGVSSWCVSCSPCARPSAYSTSPDIERQVNDDDEGCFTELLRGPPAFDDPRLLSLLREEFLLPPAVGAPATTPSPSSSSSPSSPFSSPSPSSSSSSSPSSSSSSSVSSGEGERSDFDSILDPVREKIGVPKFLVSTNGTPTEIIQDFVHQGARGLWIEPRSERSGPRQPPRHPQLWTSHACLSNNSTAYMNEAGEQCVSLSSLLEAMGRPEVDLVLCSDVTFEKGVRPLLMQYHGVVKAVLFRRTEDDGQTLEAFFDRVHVVYQYDIYTLALLREPPKGWGNMKSPSSPTLGV